MDIFSCTPRIFISKIRIFIKNPDDNDNQIATDASGIEGAGGVWFNEKLAIQVRWSETIYHQVLSKRPELKIHAQELIGSWIAFDLWGVQLAGTAVTISNDNPAAASALIIKAPPLYRSDLQCITRDFAPNLDSDRWKWLPHQRKILKIDTTEKYINNNITTKSRKKVFQHNRNILTKSNCDTDP